MTDTKPPLKPAPTPPAPADPHPSDEDKPNVYNPAPGGDTHSNKTDHDLESDQKQPGSPA